MAKRSTEKQHIHDALASLIKAQQAMSARLDRHEKILDSQAREIVELQHKVTELRNSAIKADLRSGLSGKEVAEKYDLSAARVSQIKNS